jgi:hypothetical protein
VPVIELLILLVAVEYDLPPNFVMSIALQENPQLDTYAVRRNKNGTYDRGLFQLNSSWYKDENWYCTKANTRVACAHIRWLRDQGLGWWQVAAAYNCGLKGLRTGAPKTSQRYATAVYERYRRLENGGS